MRLYKVMCVLEIGNIIEELWQLWWPRLWQKNTFGGWFDTDGYEDETQMLFFAFYIKKVGLDYKHK